MTKTYETKAQLVQAVNGTIPTTIITINDRAATREAIITATRRKGMDFVPRSDWAAHKNRSDKMVDDWNYTQIAIHHAGRSFSCGPAALQLQQIQEMQMGKPKAAADDIGYHYAIDCFGTVYEGRDIRFKGEHVHKYNTGVIGIVLLENLTTPEEGGDMVAKARTALEAIGMNQTPSVPAAQGETLEKFVSILKQYFNIAKLGGHREFPGQLGEGKICPGNIGLAYVQTLRAKTGLASPG
ncbi:peptidoglycan recognition family protein [Chromobacterium amazonense]|uniref:Peptidoglycan recognition family protein n=1 Tax=Chromobacterium amazonense TaxID=1382803 RepID=A0ABU8V2H8_9NEIS|nr:peptidoglycan recognition family protein [Chromobacterium amazonense]MDQ4541132.1 peptidoglycan recognition family protein [Chromobacterium amazonense]